MGDCSRPIHKILGREAVFKGGFLQQAFRVGRGKPAGVDFRRLLDTVREIEQVFHATAADGCLCQQLESDIVER